MLYAVFVIGVIFCSLMAITARSLLAATVWLAAVSAQVAMLMYLMGAETVAVIELSVGAGLVTVLFVFAISTAGEETTEPAHTSSTYGVIAATIAIITTTLLAWMILPIPEAAETVSAAGLTFAQTLWQQRSLDTLLQIVLISAGAMAVLGLISTTRDSRSTHEEAETPASHSDNTARSNSKPHGEVELPARADRPTQEETV
ncbi:MAG: Na(+)/H(+) antiporter subunit B [Phototrophicaceae bacterium]